MKVVVSGYYGYRNTGDEAVLAGMLRSLRALEPEIEVTVLSGDPDETARTHGVQAAPRTSPAAVATALRRSDGLISGGGSLLQDRTSPRPVAYYAGVMHLARVLDRPHVVHAQGLGPLIRGINRRLAASALGSAADVSLRDEESINLARSIGVTRPIDLVPDPALALRPAPAPGGRRNVVVALRQWPGIEPIVAGLRPILAKLGRLHGVLAVPMQEPVDRAIANAAIAGIPGADILSSTASFEERVDAFGSASLVIGMRLHALILAAAAGVPALAVSYDPKVDAFADRVGHPVVATVGRAFDPMQATSAVSSMLRGDDSDYRHRVEELRAQVPRAVATSLDALRTSARSR